MTVQENANWVYYIGNDKNLNHDKCGKWMYFFADRNFIEKICKDVVKNGIVYEAKHSNADEGVACFYLNCDDTDAHKRILMYFVANGLIRKTKAGRLYNISFKLDNQTRAGEYGKDFCSDIKLSKFIDLDSGSWLL